MPGLLYHSPADVIAWLLTVLSLASDPDASPAQPWPAYANTEPPSPDNVITVQDTTGRDGPILQFNGERQGTHGVQIRLRADDGPAGFRKANAIAIALNQVVSYPLTFQSKNYMIYTIDCGDVLPFTNQGQLSIFTINCLVSIRQVS